MNKILVDLQEFVREIAKVYGDRDAYRYIVEDTVVSKTFQEFKRDIDAVASWFVKKGWAGKHIAIIGSSGYHWVTTFLGIACSGNIVIPIDKMLSEQEMLNLLVLGDADVVFLLRRFTKPLQDKRAGMRHQNEQVNAAVKEMLEMESLTRAHGLEKTEYRNILTKVRGAQRLPGCTTGRPSASTTSPTAASRACGCSPSASPPC